MTLKNYVSHFFKQFFELNGQTENLKAQSGNQWKILIFNTENIFDENFENGIFDRKLHFFFQMWQKCKSSSSSSFSKFSKHNSSKFLMINA